VPLGNTLSSAQSIKYYGVLLLNKKKLNDNISLENITLFLRNINWDALNTDLSPSTGLKESLIKIKNEKGLTKGKILQFIDKIDNDEFVYIHVKGFLTPSGWFKPGDKFTRSGTLIFESIDKNGKFIEIGKFSYLDVEPGYAPASMAKFFLYKNHTISFGEGEWIQIKPFDYYVREVKW